MPTLLHFLNRRVYKRLYYSIRVWSITGHAEVLRERRKDSPNELYIKTIMERLRAGQILLSKIRQPKEMGFDVYDYLRKDREIGRLMCEIALSDLLINPSIFAAQEWRSVLDIFPQDFIVFDADVLIGMYIEHPENGLNLIANDLVNKPRVQHGDKTITLPLQMALCMF